MIRDYMRKDLADFKPYHSPLKPYTVKIDANENPYPHSPAVLDKIRQWAEDKDNLTRYPDTDINVLREKLGSLFNVSKNQVICTVGSDQLIELIIKVFVEAGETVLVPNPSFSMYTLSTVLNHGKAVAYELDENYDYDYDLIIDKYRVYQPKVVFICTPNNPTGNVASLEGIRKVLDNVSCPVVIDEAYEEFTGESAVNLIKDYPQLIVLRTFSKAYGIAGLRIGYGISNEEMIDIIGVAKPPYNVSSFSQAVATFILDDIEYYKSLACDIIASKNRLIDSLRSSVLFEHVFDSAANFILAKVVDRKDANVIAAYLADNEVLVRDYGNNCRLENHIRFTVGTDTENERLIELLNQIQ